MIVGLFAKIFARPTLEEVFDAVLAQDVRAVQFNFACAGLPSLPDQLDDAVLQQIREAARTRQLSLAAVSGTCNLIHPDPVQRRAGLQRLKVVCEASPALGARVVTLCTGTRDPHDMWRQHPDNITPEAWRDLLESLTQALGVAESCGVTLGLEPEVANVISSAARARRLLDELRSAHLKIVLDPANLFHPGDLGRMRDRLDEAFDLLAPDLVLAHGKELAANGHAGNLALGAGVLDWSRYFSLLRRTGFNGALILHGFEEAAVPTSLSFVRERITAPAARAGEH